MIDLVVTSLFMIAPLVISGVLHMVVISKKFLPQLAVPISKNKFGANKTWRGMLAVPILTVLGVWMILPLESYFSEHLLFSFQQKGSWFWGIYLGLGYVAAELPNSFLKRKLGIAEGKRPANNKVLFALVDQADSAIGCALVFWLLGSITPALAVALVILATSVHLFFNVMLYFAGLRKEPL